MLITANLVTNGAKISATIVTVITVTIDPKNQMTKVASSPERHTFQKEGYVKRCEEQGKEPNPNLIAMYNSWQEHDENNLVNLEWQKNNMEYDLRACKELCDKVKQSDNYAQNLYAAMCNRQFLKLELIPVLKDDRWSCSWRHAGGIIADMQEKGDYIDWYCSGIGSQEDGYGLDYTVPDLSADGRTYVPESVVTDEIREDLKQLGWIVLDEEDDDR